MSISAFGRLVAAAIVIAMSTTACAPSMPYILGTGFYSESYSKSQVQAAANNGKVKFLGKFSEDGTSCGNYVQESTDNNLVLPVVKSQLNTLKGNAADNIVAKWNFSDFMLAFTLLPALAGCRSFTISGEALLVQP